MSINEQSNKNSTVSRKEKMNERHEFNDANNDFHIYNTVYIKVFYDTCLPTVLCA